MIKIIKCNIGDRFKLISITILALLLSACAQQTRYVVPPLKYQGKTIHVPRTASLYWQHGDEQTGTSMHDYGPSLSGLIANMIETNDRKNHPSRYYFSYGKAEQVAFITNLRDVLEDRHVFKKIEIITNPKQIKKNDVLITVKFKSTRVRDYNFKITLITALTIKSGDNSFSRTYVTESDEGSFFNGTNYNTQIADVSQKMLNQLMSGIKTWSRIS